MRRGRYWVGNRQCVPEGKTPERTGRLGRKFLKRKEPGDLEGGPWVGMVGSDGVRMHCGGKATLIGR